MKVTTLDEKSIRDIGHAFGYYDYEEETGMSAAFSGKEATANYICAYVRGGAAGRLSAHHQRAGRGIYRLQAAKGEDGTQDDVAHRLRNAAQLHPEAPFAIWYCHQAGRGLPARPHVVVEELIPEMSQGQHSNVGTVFFAVGFSVMMVLDVALG